MSGPPSKAGDADREKDPLPATDVTGSRRDSEKTIAGQDSVIAQSVETRPADPPPNGGYGKALVRAIV